jgi:4-hydroxybenzoate polyprenyltransferase
LLAGALKLRHEPEITSVSFVLSRVVLCSLASYIFSGAGMVWNDWVDRDIDAKVARTKDRPLASGRLRTIEAMAWLIIQVAASTGLLYWMMEGRHV